MSDLASDKSKAWNWTPGEVPQVLQDRLSSLRRSITGWIWIEALAKLSLLLVGIVVIDFALDYFFHMDQAQRVIFGLLVLSSFAYCIYRFLIVPISAQSSDDALVLAVERKLGQSNNPLISTIQFARDKSMSERGYSPAMAQHVIQEGLESVGKLDFSQALNKDRLKQNRWLLNLGLASLAILVLLTASTQTGRLWFSRNLLLGDQPWPTATRLTINGVENGELIVPRGEDHRLEVMVDPDCANPNVEVYVDFMSRSTGARQKLRVDSNDPFAHSTTLRSINSEFQFQVIGGDFTSPPIQIRLVQPPGFSELKLTAIPPKYSGLGEQALPLSAENYKLLVGSELVIEAKSDKPNATLALLNGQNRYAIPSDHEGIFGFKLSGASLVTGRYQFDLRDESNISGGRPVEFSLDILADKPPQIRARHYGVTGLVVPRAQVPVSIAVEDEFSITQVWGDLNWEAEGVATRGNQRQDINEFADELGQPELSSSHLFDLEPLEIPTGMMLSISVSAQDNQPVAKTENTLGQSPASDDQTADDLANARPKDASVGTSKIMVFRVVTEAELRADLLRREIEQTKTFERLISQQQAIVTELQVLQASEKQGSETADSFLARQNQLASKAVRNQHQVGTLLVQVTDRFRGFLDEIRNNRLDNGLENMDEGQSLSLRIDQQIVRPLDSIDRNLMPLVDRSMELVSRTVGDEPKMQASIDSVLPQLEEVLQKLNAVLEAMQRTQSFQEIVNTVIAIKNDEQRLKKLAEEKKRNDSAIDEIFD